MTNSQAGVNLNIMASNKPKRLEMLTYQNIKRFLSEFTHYQHETSGNAVVSGYISDEVVAVIDSLLGAQEEYRPLLCHGKDVEVQWLSEEERGSRPWLYTSDPKDWKSLLEALMVLKPSGGAYLSQTYENLLARAEETSINFAFDHLVSGEDKYVQDLLETDKACELSQYSAQQVRAYFSLLIIGSKVSTYKGVL